MAEHRISLVWKEINEQRDANKVVVLLVLDSRQRCTSLFYQHPPIYLSTSLLTVMSVSDRFPLDPEKLQTLTRDEAINLISVLAKNMKHSPSEDCLQRLTSLCLPQPKLPIETSESLGSQSKKKNKKKVFDISNYRQRHIALHLYYDGAKYQGEGVPKFYRISICLHFMT